MTPALFPNGQQDLITPFICSDRWPDDTLFFVFEEDMEFFQRGIIPGRIAVEATNHRLGSDIDNGSCHQGCEQSDDRSDEEQSDAEDAGAKPK